MASARADQIATLVIDARAAVPQVDGLGRYLRELVPRLLARSGSIRTHVLVLPSMEAFWREAIPGASIQPVDCRPMWPSQQWVVPIRVRALAPDVYFYPAHDPPLLVPARLVFTVLDLTQVEFPGFHEHFNRPKALYTRAITRLALQRAARVFAISEETTRTIGQLFGRQWLSKVTVTPLGAPEIEPVTGSAKTHLLYVGTDRPHKNLPRLLRAYARARESSQSVPTLRVVGGLRHPESLRSIIRDRGLSDSVELCGHVSADRLNDLYRHALALIFPSLREGFGMPILEAMARGIPVVTSNISGTAEVAGSAALTVDPYDEEALASAIVRVTRDDDLRGDLGARGINRAREFSWDRCADATMEVLRAVARS